MDLIKENDFTLKKKEQKVDDILQKLWQMQSMQMTEYFSQIHQRKQNPHCIAYSNQQKTLTSTWMQLKQSTCVLNKRTIYTLSDQPLKFVDPIAYFGSNISSTENDVNIRLTKEYRQVIDRTETWSIR